MKVQVLSLSATLLFAFSASIDAQTAPVDSKPVIQGEVGFTMPQAAIDAELGGSVRLGVRVEETGKVSKVWLLAGPVWACGKSPGKAIDKLSDNLSDALKAMQFEPAYKNGKPVTENIALTVKLDNPKLLPEPLQTDVISGRTNPKLAAMGIINGKPINFPKPEYPAAARTNMDGGAIPVQIVIDQDGKVIRAGALNGATTLQPAARDAACSAKFSPTTQSGTPIKVTGVVVYNFVPPQRR